MKVKRKEEQTFHPIKIELIFESKKEIQALLSLIGYISATEKCNLISRKTQENPSTYKINNLKSSDFVELEIICDVLKDYLPESEY